MSKKYGIRRGIAPTALRRIAVSAVFLVMCVGIVVHGAVSGTLSSFGWDAVAYLCPLGALEAMIGQWAIIPRLLAAFAVVVFVTLLVGRSFCAWVCPVPSLVGLLKTKRRAGIEKTEKHEAEEYASENFRRGVRPRRSRIPFDSRHIVLCGALGTTAVFGFPVFCLVCPIGLTFALVVGVVRLVGFNEPSWSLVLFAGILVFEVVFLRSWCSKICPLGALLSLIARCNKTFRPDIDRNVCLRSTKGDACGVCSFSCPEHIDPQGDRGIVSMDECTRCGACAEACPQRAISFPFRARCDDSRTD